jgi:hypothetical protein
MKLRFLLSLLLPYRRTTADQARQALLKCGISPDAISWKVAADGSFTFARKNADADGLAEAQIQCLLDWTRRERIKVFFIG